MYVVKRNGDKQPVSFDKITIRIRRLAEEPSPLPHVDPVLVAQKVVTGVYDGVTTTELDNLAAEEAAYMSTQHPNYSILAARIATSNLHKVTSSDWIEVVDRLYGYVNPRTGLAAPLIADDVYEVIKKSKDRLTAAIDYKRDYSYDYFGFKTLQRSYLLKIDNAIIERPQQMLMRVSVGIHKEDIDKAIETYDLMSQLWFTHASPTLFNSGTPNNQLSSCFLVTMKDDSIEGIYETLKLCALISKSAGGIGLNVHQIRASGSYIRGTNGNSNGLVPMLRVFNDTARYVDQGGAKRPGAFAIYLEPWHSDVFEFLDLRKNTGKEEQRARDLFYALWIPDLFMKRVESNGMWSLFCPNECPGLSDCWGEEFERLYERYEAEGKAIRTVPAQDLWFAVLESQIETGTPYVLYKDACNSKSNHQHLGTIKCSNLCTEIVEYSAPDEVAVCNLASIALSRFADRTTGTFDYDRLFEVTKVVTRNLNRIIDINKYPVEEARRSNLRHRPIGIGVQGLADVFLKLRVPFDSEEARTINRDIFETIYFAALTASCELARIEGPYETYQGSPVSRGILQHDMWGVVPSSNRWNWDKLRADIRAYGVRNSLLLAPMPTASTSQILGNNECFEPYTSNLYTRRVLAGEFAVVNKFLVEDLLSLGLWTPAMRNKIFAERGSIQDIDEIPQNLKDTYKTVWEIKQRSLIDMAADRGAYIDQSQSLNIHIAEPTFAKLTSMHFYSWRKGLKTGMYYLRTQPAAKAIQFTVDQQQLKETLAAPANSEATTAASPRSATGAGPSPLKAPFGSAALKAKKRRLSGQSEEPEVYGEVCTMKEGCIMCSG